jgi:tRNA G10  N-methylase Trm11
MGTVLVEALSMGIDIVGRDINWFATKGSRENIAHFGYNCDVMTGPISDVTNRYDAAIIDMPYNVVTHVTPEEQLAMLQHARRFTKRLVVVTTEIIDETIKEAGFQIVDRCEVKKSVFTRQVVLCE